MSPVRILIRLVFQLLYRIRYPQTAELIVVPLLIILVLAILTPAILLQRDRVLRQQTQYRIQQVSLGLNTYHDTYQSYPVSPKKRQEAMVDDQRPVVKKGPLVRRRPTIRKQEPELVSPL